MICLNSLGAGSLWSSEARRLPRSGPQSSRKPSNRRRMSSSCLAFGTATRSTRGNLRGAMIALHSLASTTYPDATLKSALLVARRRWDAAAFWSNSRSSTPMRPPAVKGKELPSRTNLRLDVDADFGSNAALTWFPQLGVRAKRPPPNMCLRASLRQTDRGSLAIGCRGRNFDDDSEGNAGIRSSPRKNLATTSGWYADQPQSDYAGRPLPAMIRTLILTSSRKTRRITPRLAF